MKYIKLGIHFERTSCVWVLELSFNEISGLLYANGRDEISQTIEKNALQYRGKNVDVQQALNIISILDIIAQHWLKQLKTRRLTWAA